MTGDLDGDGRLTREDFSILQSYLDGTSSLTEVQVHQADWNSDGRVDETDLQNLRAAIVGAQPDAPALAPVARIQLQASQNNPPARLQASSSVLEPSVRPSTPVRMPAPSKPNSQLPVPGLRFLSSFPGQLQLQSLSKVTGMPVSRLQSQSVMFERHLEAMAIIGGAAVPPNWPYELSVDQVKSGIIGYTSGQTSYFVRNCQTGDTSYYDSHGRLYQMEFWSSGDLKKGNTKRFLYPTGLPAGRMVVDGSRRVIYTPFGAVATIYEPLKPPTDGRVKEMRLGRSVQSKNSVTESVYTTCSR